MSTPADPEIKQQVQAFYDHVGWKRVGDCCYQNARYEDLRPVSQEYVHRCHLRVTRHITPSGKYLLDAGSGPIQYPEYLEYSKGYQYRVCADISHVALKEARERINDHGLFVVSDVANLPFKEDIFGGVVSLHTFHHLPRDEQVEAYAEIFRVMIPSNSAVIVNGWRESPLMRFFSPLIRIAVFILRIYRRATGRESYFEQDQHGSNSSGMTDEQQATFVHREDPSWLKQEIGSEMPLEIFVWRSVSTDFLRTLIHRKLGGRLVLRLLYWLEECAPRVLGLYGQYPLIVIRKA
ncbi:MAG TPA: class I SAM-dependent methyltransferase [Anaerolineae bacterium]|nr:class I SAM-dependent methyltransferase [Anaerolineae bacterium]